MKITLFTFDLFEETGNYLDLFNLEDPVLLRADLCAAEKVQKTPGGSISPAPPWRESCFRCNRSMKKPFGKHPKGFAFSKSKGSFFIDRYSTDRGIASSAAPAAFLQNPLASHILAAIIGWVFQAFDRTASSAHFAFSLSAHTIGAVLILIGNRVFVSAIVIPSGSTGVSACSAPGCLAGGLFCFFLAIGAQNPALSLTGCAQKTAIPVTIFALDQAAPVHTHGSLPAPPQ